MKKYFLFLMTLGLNLGYAQPWTKNFEYVDDWNFGLAKVSKNQKVGFVDPKGKLVVDLIYDEAFAFSEGYAAVKTNGKWGYIDSTGKEVIAAVYSEVGCFSEGYAKVAKNGSWGFIDKEGRTVIALKFENAGNFTDGLAPVCNQKGLWGYINKDGKEIIGFKYSRNHKKEIPTYQAKVTARSQLSSRVIAIKVNPNPITNRIVKSQLINRRSVYQREAILKAGNRLLL